jgi:1,4-alpha-glucan branching enzyme
VRDLNTFYRAHPALYELDTDSGGFEWIDANDGARSIISFRRKGRNPSEHVVFACNLTPVPRQNYRIGVPSSGEWTELLNSDAPLYGGSGQGNAGAVRTAPVPMHGYPVSVNLTLPPLAMIALKKA